MPKIGSVHTSPTFGQVKITSHNDDGTIQGEGLEKHNKGKIIKLLPSHLVSSEEAVSASSAGQLQRPPTTPQKEAFKLPIKFYESAIADPNSSTREVSVLIIKEGMGNKVDRHYYSAELLSRIAPMFEGVKAYADHPSKTEESDRPERSIRDIVGYYHSPRVIVVEGKAAISAVLKINDGPAYDWAWNLVKEAALFAKKYADKDLVGISINAFGASHQVEGLDGIVNMVDDLTEVQSADIVTQAGAGGGFRLREAVKKALHREGSSQGGTVKDLLSKHGEGLKALRDKIKGEPEHEKAYGGAIDELMAHHTEMGEAYEKMVQAEPPKAEPKDEPKAEPAPAPKDEANPAPAADPVKPEVVAPDKEGQLIHLPEPGTEGESEAEKAFKGAEADYKAGKLSADGKRIFEMVLKARSEQAIRENSQMVSKTIKESGIPEAYSSDLTLLCAGRGEAEVRKLVESRKALVTPLLGNKGNGAGAAPAAPKTESPLSAKLAEAGVKLKE